MGGAEAVPSYSLAWLHRLTIVRQIDCRPLVNLGVFYIIISGVYRFAY
jgi:hypothetical protein